MPFIDWGNSVSTSGVIISQPLGKAQCNNCGFVQRVTQDYLGLTDYYEDDYQTYFDRVGAEEYDHQRYVIMAKWLKNSIRNLEPENILDVGCGRGWMIKEVSTLYPTSKIIGVEPSQIDSTIARENGLNVITGKLNQVKDKVGKFDLIYSNNVIQHTVSAKEFLLDLKEKVKENGLVVLTLPDSSKPSNEMMWSDQNYSFSPSNVTRLAQDLGLRVEGWFPAPNVHNLKDKQLIALRSNRVNEDNKNITLPKFNIKKNIRERINYLDAWGKLDSILIERINNGKKIYNFGASMWSYLLRGYCPNYWSMVEACVVDNYHGEFMDRIVLPFEAVNFDDDDRLVLGINPNNHKKLLNRFKNKKLQVITWDDIIQR